MIRRVLADRLLELCSQRAEQVAEAWYQALIKNPKTAYLRAVSQEVCLRHATYFYKNLRGMYFAIVTLALAEIFRVIVRNLPDLTGGPEGTGFEWTRRLSVEVDGTPGVKEVSQALLAKLA